MCSKLKHYVSVIKYTYKIDILKFIEYPTQLIPLLAAWFLFDLGQFYMINLMITQFHPFPGWGQYEVAFLYGYALLSESMVVFFFYSTFQISNMVLHGEFDTFLIRPLAVYPQFALNSLNFVALSDVVSAIIIIIFSLRYIELSVALFFKSFIFLFSAVLLRTAIFTIVNSVSFWTKKATSLHSICCFMTIRIPKFPLTVLPKILQSVFSFVFPIAYIAYFPVECILSKKLEDGFLSGFYMILLVSFGVYLLSIYVFQNGLKNYESSGS